MSAFGFFLRSCNYLFSSPTEDEKKKKRSGLFLQSEHDAGGDLPRPTSPSLWTISVDDASGEPALNAESRHADSPMNDGPTHDADNFGLHRFGSNGGRAPRRCI